MSTVKKVTTVVSDVVTVNFYATAYNAEGSIQDTMIEAGSTRGNFVRGAIWAWGTEFPDLTPLIESVTPLRYVTSIKVTLSADTTAGCSDGRNPTAQLVFNKEKYGWNTMVSGTTTFEYDMTQGEPESGGLVEIETVAFNAWNYPVGEVTFNVSIAVTVAVEEAPTIEGTQLVLSGNRVLAYGDNCFVSMGGTVICEETGKAYQNATVVTHTGGIPADIDTVGYEYHAGVFVPCAPYGMGDGNGYLMEMCTDCATPKNSGIKVKELRWQTLGSVVCSATCDGLTSTASFTIPVSRSALAKFLVLRYKIKAGSYFAFTNVVLESRVLEGEVYNLVTDSMGEPLYTLTAPYTASAAGATYGALLINFEKDLELPAHMFSRCYQNRNTVSGATEVQCKWYTAQGEAAYSIDPLTINIKLPLTAGNACNLTIELEGLRGGCEI